MLAVSLVRNLPALLLTAGDSPLLHRTWSCITLIRTEEETVAASEQRRGLSNPLKAVTQQAAFRGIDRGRPRVDGGVGGGRLVGGGRGDGGGAGGASGAGGRLWGPRGGTDACLLLAA